MPGFKGFQPKMSNSKFFQGFRFFDNPVSEMFYMDDYIYIKKKSYALYRLACYNFPQVRANLNFSKIKICHTLIFITVNKKLYL